MPKVMQVKSGMFGKIGQTKYTSLKDQDTSSQDSLFGGMLNNAGPRHHPAGAGGVGPGGGGGSKSGGFERPSASKRKRD